MIFICGFCLDDKYKIRIGRFGTYKIKKYKNTEMECVLDIYLLALAGWQIYPSFLTATLHPPHKPAVHKKEEMETEKQLKKTKEPAQNRHGNVSSSSEVKLEFWEVDEVIVRKWWAGWSGQTIYAAHLLRKQAHKPRSYASPKLRPTHSVTDRGKV